MGNTRLKDHVPSTVMQQMRECWAAGEWMAVRSIDVSACTMLTAPDHDAGRSWTKTLPSPAVQQFIGQQVLSY